MTTADDLHANRDRLGDLLAKRLTARGMVGNVQATATGFVFTEEVGPDDRVIDFPWWCEDVQELGQQL